MDMHKTYKELDNSKVTQYLTNPALPIIKANWKGNPMSASGRFLNHQYPFVPQFADILKWKSKTNPELADKKKDSFRVDTIETDAFLTSGKDGICWLGHATFLFRVKGKLFLTDPVFSSPSLLMKRFSNLPFSPGRLDDLDYLLISHDHRDHLDERSLKSVFRVADRVEVFTGLRIGSFIQNIKPSVKVQEAGWFQQYTIGDGIELFYLPARHWCKRGLTDTNYRLWGSFLIRTPELTIYFGADSGYGGHFKEIGELFPNIDFALLGIGAYKPEWFMEASHTSPEKALQAAEDLKCKHFIPMHYGTFDLADESLSDPIRTAKQLFEKGKSSFQLVVPGVGEPVYAGEKMPYRYSF